MSCFWHFKVPIFKKCPAQDSWRPLTNLRPTTAKGPKKGPWDPFLKKVAKQDPFWCLGIPPFSTKQHFYLCLKKSFPTGPNHFWCVKFPKSVQNINRKTWKSPLNIPLVGVWKNKNKKYGNLMYRCQIIWHIIWHKITMIWHDVK